MLSYIHGNLLESACSYLVNPVNTVGVMGAGLALQFKNHYPNNFNLYKYKCARGFVLGEVLVVSEKGKFIINFPTKQHWKDSSQMSYITNSLKALSQYHNNHKIVSIAFPKVGCGLGGLEWEGVKSLLEAWHQENKIEYMEVYI